MFGTVLVGTDGSDRAERAVHAAIDVAKGQNARLVIVAAFRDEDSHREPITSAASVAKGNLRDAADQLLMRCARHAEEQGMTEVDWEARAGHPADVIIDIASERGIDLIVVGNKGMTGARRYLVGGVADKVSHHAPCSVMIVRTDE
jgi:nucleotide-binding universal stress UspA family protein